MPRKTRRRIQVSDDESDESSFSAADLSVAKDAGDATAMASRRQTRSTRRVQKRQASNSPVNPRQRVKPSTSDDDQDSDDDHDSDESVEKEDDEDDDDEEEDEEESEEEEEEEKKNKENTEEKDQADEEKNVNNSNNLKDSDDDHSKETIDPDEEPAKSSKKLENQQPNVPSTPNASHSLENIPAHLRSPTAETPAPQSTASQNPTPTADVSGNDSFLINPVAGSTPNALSTPIGLAASDIVNSSTPDTPVHPVQKDLMPPPSRSILNLTEATALRPDTPLEPNSSQPPSSQTSPRKPTSSSSSNMGPPPSTPSSRHNSAPKTPHHPSLSGELPDFASRGSVSHREPMASFRLQNTNVATLVPISPSKTRLRALEAEKKASMLHLAKVPRLVISKLVLNNFKSYAGVQEIGPFDNSFSAVVGPNGSGKSNVIDSLLFVFGFRASKLRQGKVSGLIHNSKAQPNVSSCKVEIHFKEIVESDDGGSQDVPNSVLVVARAAYKNNKSEYFINGRASTYTEVTTLMRQRGIDLDHKRFLILQGEVESISQMKPKAENDNDDGLLEYLEDIIGTSDHKKAIEEAENDLTLLTEDCDAKTSRFEIVKKDIEKLQDKRDEVVRNMRLENELTMKRSLFYQVNIRRLEASITSHTEDLEKSTAQLEKDREESREIREEIVHLEEQVKTDGEALSELRKQHQKLSKNLSRHEIQKVQVEEKAKHLTAKQKKLEKQIVTSQRSFNEADSWIKNYDEQAEEFRARSHQLEKDLETKQEEYNEVQESLKGKTENITKEISKLQQELAPWREKIAAKEADIAIAQSEIDIINEKHENAKKSLKRSKQHVATIVKEGEQKEQRLVELEQSLVYVTDQISKGTVEVEEAAVKIKKMKEELDEFRTRYQVAKESVSSAKSLGAVLTSLTNLSSSGRIEGFNGRLGSLGTIDQKYDVAISTACPALDNLVVDTVDVGEECVKYLRKNNIGRAKFILLDKLPKRNLKPIRTPEDVPRLFDLITPKESRFAPAFYSVLFDTLVAKDVEQARRIAYGAHRFRVVTLNGVVIDTSGTMSGGGRPSQGRMKSQLEAIVTPQEMTQLEEEHSEREAKYARAENAFQKINNALRDYNRQKPQIELEISKGKLDIESLKGVFEEAEREYAEMKNNIIGTIPSAEDLEKAQEKKSNLEKELAQIQENSADLEKRISDLREKIMEIGGVKLRFLKSQIDDIKNEMEMISSRTSSQVLERTKKENERKKHTRAMESARSEIEAARNEVLASEQELEQHRAEVSQLEDEVETTRVAILEKEDALNELKKTTKEKRELVDKTLSAEIELVNSIEHLQKALRGFRHSLKCTNEEFGKLTLHAVHQIPQVNTREDNEEDAENDEKEEDYVEIVRYSSEELGDVNPLDVEREIKTLESKLEDVVIDSSIIHDYIRRAKEYNNRRTELAEVTTQREAKKRRCENLHKQRLEEFLEGFNLISLKLKEMYQMITMGGNAELELVDSLDPFSEGILFSVMPPKKSWKNISNLSGGEKTLSSLALVFALHHYKPTPLYVMDEIDAALDFRNVSIVANYIRERTKNGQFIVISLRNNMFELASQLVGIYKVNNMTKSVAIKNKDQPPERSSLQIQQQIRSTTFSASQPSQAQLDRRSTVGSMYGSVYSQMSDQNARHMSVGLSTATSSRQSSMAPGEGSSRHESTAPTGPAPSLATKQGSHVTPMTVLPDDDKQEKDKAAEPEKTNEKENVDDDSTTSGSEDEESEDEDGESDKENVIAPKKTVKKKVEESSDSSDEEQEEDKSESDEEKVSAPNKVKNKVEESLEKPDDKEDEDVDQKDTETQSKEESESESSDSSDSDSDDDSIEIVSSFKHETPQKAAKASFNESSDEEKKPKQSRILRKRPQRRGSAPTGGTKKKIKKEESSSDEEDSDRDSDSDDE